MDKVKMNLSSIILLSAAALSMPTISWTNGFGLRGGSGLMNTMKAGRSSHSS